MAGLSQLHPQLPCALPRQEAPYRNHQTLPDPAEVVTRALELAGGRDAILAGLGSTARLTFANKLRLLDMQGSQLADARMGILHPNKIRNRIAHRLDAGISADDAAVFLSVE